MRFTLTGSSTTCLTIICIPLTGLPDLEVAFDFEMRSNSVAVVRLTDITFVLARPKLHGVTPSLSS